MDSWFVGALEYADMLMAPTVKYGQHSTHGSGAMRRMLAVCDEFAVKLDVKFNASKSKCMFFFVRESHINHKHTERLIALVITVLNYGIWLVGYCSTWRKGLRRIWELPYTSFAVITCLQFEALVPYMTNCVGVFF